jgi:hypothetical protein
MEPYAWPVPLTLAHPAAVLPLRGLRLPMGALVVGSMVPDVPLFIRWPGGYRLAHDWLGVVTVDLAGALVLLCTWSFVLRDALVDLAPGFVRDRLADRRRLGWREWTLTPVAAVIGSVTHLVWDAFTHRNRWGVASVDWLQADLGPLPGYRWAQYISGVVGLAVVLAASASYVLSRAARSDVGPRVLPGPSMLLVVGAAVAYATAAGLARWSRGLHAVAFHAAVGGIAALAVGTALTCLLWQLVARSRATPCRGRGRSQQ